ncbi:MAG: hypothetical protein AB7L17_10640 [Ilumatobacteraceae bacterium]
MYRIDDPAIYDPFCCRLADLADPATSPRRHRELIEELVVCEAEEVAHGHRHLTVVHGCPDNLPDSRHLDAFYDTVRVLATRTGWVRVRGTTDYVTITVRGDDADRHADAFAAAASAVNPGRWVIVPAPYPPSVAASAHR